MNSPISINRPINTERTRKRSVNILLLAAIVLGALLLFALASCENNTRGKQTTTDRDTLSSSVAPNANVDSSQLGRHTIEVNLTDDAIGLPAEATSGPTIFRVMNAGTTEHGLEVEGNGQTYRLDANLEPGGAKELLVDLKPGTYQLYCPVDGHKGKGLSRQLTVTQ
jgi:outer membrane murein-binding lipoprotein Lpp